MADWTGIRMSNIYKEAKAFFAWIDAAYEAIQNEPEVLDDDPMYRQVSVVKGVVCVTSLHNDDVIRIHGTRGDA